MSAPLPRAAVIGAGSSGITALKTLVERDFDVTCYASKRHTIQVDFASADTEPAAA